MSISRSRSTCRRVAIRERARSQGGAVINYAVHSLAPTMEPLVNICASGVAERHPKLRFGSIEAGIGWVAWALDCHGRGVPQASHVGAAEVAAPPGRVLPSPGLRQLPGGSARPRPCPRAMVWSTTSCGRTTSRTTKERGRIRRKRSSGRWVISTTASAPRSSDSTALACSSSPYPSATNDIVTPPP